jgi:hypothetical protein
MVNMDVSDVLVAEKQRESSAKEGMGEAARALWPRLVALSD